MTQQQKTLEAKNTGLRFPQKHLKALKGIALIAVLEARGKHPEWNLNEVLSDLVKGFNPELPPQFLLELTQHVIQTWVTLEEKQAAAVAA